VNFALQLQLGTDHGDGCLRILDAKSRPTMTPLPLKPTALIRLRVGLPVPIAAPKAPIWTHSKNPSKIGLDNYHARCVEREALARARPAVARLRIPFQRGRHRSRPGLRIIPRRTCRLECRFAAIAVRRVDPDSRVGSPNRRTGESGFQDRGCRWSRTCQALRHFDFDRAANSPSRAWSLHYRRVREGESLATSRWRCSWSRTNCPRQALTLSFAV
jgi:hypothetical protein